MFSLINSGGTGQRPKVQGFSHHPGTGLWSHGLRNPMLQSQGHPGHTGLWETHTYAPTYTHVQPEHVLVDGQWWQRQRANVCVSVCVRVCVCVGTAPRGAHPSHTTLI